MQREPYESVGDALARSWESGCLLPRHRLAQ